jgi:preprotein translocase subunit SecG
MTIICAALLIIVVLIQKGKGGGLTSGLGQGNQMMGVKKTTDFLEKATWVLASALVVFCLLASFSLSTPETAEPTDVQQQTEHPQNNSATAPVKNPE